MDHLHHRTAAAASHRVIRRIRAAPVVQSLSDVKLEGPEESQVESTVTDDSIQEMLLLAARLREQTGGELDDSAIVAVSEATGAPVEYVRLAVRALPENRRKSSLIQRIKTSFLAFDQDVRRWLAGGVLGAAFGLCTSLGSYMQDSSGLFGTLAVIAMIAGLWNAAVSRDGKTAAISGATLTGTAFFANALFLFVLNNLFGLRVNGPESFLLVFSLIAGAAGGTLAQTIANGYRRRHGIKDPVRDRHELLHQLLELQDRLKSDEQFVTFLSVDIVGSTRLKAESDPLAVEFTFNEYHRYVETVCRKHGGRIHSTAGDGVTCFFDRPDQAFAAGKAIQAGLFEFNAYRNRLAEQIVLRAGMHTGSVLAPGRDLQAVNFAHVIDIAAHMQKVAPPGTLVVSEATAIYLPGGRPSIGQESVSVQDVSGVIWRPKASVPRAIAAPPQP